jgi:hypothetical protein
MRPSDDFRQRAIQFTHKAAQQADADEANRLRNIASYWLRLADAEEWSIDRAVQKTNH